MTFDELYDQNFDFVWRTLRRLGVPDADLPDVAQEVFVVVHRRLGSFVERAKVTTWLFRIAVRAARDRRRKAHVRREVSGEDWLAREPDRTEGPLGVLERRDDRALFDRAISSMDLEQRAVFCAFELEGMTGQDIALALEIPLGTVYSRLRLGRERFRAFVLRATRGQSGTRFRLGGA
jgi:RNA polymerase sigma-70 factor (ECF subfamily)